MLPSARGAAAAPTPGVIYVDPARGLAAGGNMGPPPSEGGGQTHVGVLHGELHGGSPGVGVLHSGTPEPLKMHKIKLVPFCMLFLSLCLSVRLGLFSPFFVSH